MPPVAPPDLSAERLGCLAAASSPAATAATPSGRSAGGSAPALKVNTSVDIEGSVGIAHWDGAAKSHGNYAEFHDRMTQETVAACEGVLAVHLDAEIWVKSAHGSGRNILQEQLPRACKLIRGWRGHPYAMVQELDGTFDACCFVGYRGHAAHPSNPLSHINTGLWDRLKMNDEDLSEYLQHAYVAASECPSSSFPATSASATSLAAPIRLSTRSPLIPVWATVSWRGCTRKPPSRKIRAGF